MTVKLNGRVVIDLEVEGANPTDYPDFCDAYFSYAVFEDTLEELTDDQLLTLSEDYGDVVNEMAFESFT